MLKKILKILSCRLYFNSNIQMKSWHSIWCYWVLYTLSHLVGEGSFYFPILFPHQYVIELHHIHSNLALLVYYSQCSLCPLVKGSNPRLVFIRLYWLLHRQAGILFLPRLTSVPFTPGIKYLKAVKLDHHQFSQFNSV